MWDTIKETRENLIADYCQSHIVDIIPLKNLLCGNNVHDTPEYERKTGGLERFKIRSTHKLIKRRKSCVTLTAEMSFCINLKTIECRKSSSKIERKSYC